MNKSIPTKEDIKIRKWFLLALNSKPPFEEELRKDMQEWLDSKEWEEK